MVCKFGGLFSVLFLTVPFAFAPSVLSADRQAFDYKLVPNLQEMTDHPPAPQFTLPNFQGKSVGLKDFRGKLLMLNFWASWCVACREEMPAMERLYQTYKNRGFAILGVNLKDEKKAALSFVEQLNITFPTAFDPDGRVGLMYGAWGLPATYLIDADGTALARAWGPANWFSPGARKLIETLLDAKNGPGKY